MPIRMEFKALERVKKNVLTGTYNISLNPISRENEYQSIYFEQAEKLLLEQIDECAWLTGRSMFSQEDLDADQRRLENEFYNVTMRNAVSYTSSNGGKRKRDLSMMPYSSRPDLANPFADMLDRNYLIFFTARGVHYYAKNRADEPLPTEARGLFNFTAWVVDGNTGEFILAVSDISTKPRNAFIYHLAALPEGKQPKRINERLIEQAAKSVVSNLEKALQQKDLIE